MPNYTVMIPSHRPQLMEKVVSSIAPIVPIHIDGTGAKCFSWLVNKCIQECPTEIVIICADKAYPSANQIELMVERIQSGFGLVAMYRFAFFGFKKELIRKIGWFDERYMKGTWEDNDIALRLREADIAYYESQEVSYQSMPCSWQTWSEAERHYHF
jgi:GT2 family glycosyltransferase